MSHGQETCVFCRIKLDPALENYNVPGGWARIRHERKDKVTHEPTCFRHTGVRKTLCQQTIPSMLSGIEGPEVPPEKLEAALVAIRSRKATKTEER